MRERGCSPREQDGKGALLSGWFVMTHEGLPGDGDLREGIAALDDYIITAEQTRADDAPRRALTHMLNHMVALHRSTDRDAIGLLLDIAYGAQSEYAEGRDPQSAALLLQRYGIRPIRACTKPAEISADKCTCSSCFDLVRKKPIPRLSRNSGLWISTRHEQLDQIFEKTAFDGGRWRHQLMRLSSARSSGKSIRIGGASGYAFWLDANELHLPDDDAM